LQERVAVHDVDGTSIIHQSLGEPVVSYIGLHDMGDSVGVFDPRHVIDATPGDALLRPI
jgi:hypothetical protein